MISISTAKIPHRQVVDSLKDASLITTSRFYLTEIQSVPWSSNPTTLELTTTNVGEIHIFYLDDVKVLSTVIGQEISNVSLLLKKGSNKIEITSNGERFVTYIAATMVDTWLHGQGKEIYTTSAKRVSEITRLVSSSYSSYFATPFLPNTDSLPQDRMARIQSTKMLVKGIMEGGGKNSSILSVLTALTQQTPWMENLKPKAYNSIGELPFETNPTSAEEFAGVRYHVWSTNTCENDRLTLLNLLSSVGSTESPLTHRIIDNSPNQVIVDVEGRREVVQFTPNSECFDNKFSSPCDYALVEASVTSILDVIYSANNFGLDTQIVRPLWQGLFDASYVFDGDNPASSGTNATILSVIDGIATIQGLVGVIPSTQDRYLRVSGAAQENNQGDFLITQYISDTEVKIAATGMNSSDLNNGSLSWVITPPIAGIAGGDVLDNALVIDRLGDGFLGATLTGGLDSGYLDSVPERARRMSQHGLPLFPDPNLTSVKKTGQDVTIFIDSTSPPATLGTSSFWCSVEDYFIPQGDILRLSLPTEDLVVLSAYPQFNGIAKSITNGSYIPSVSSRRFEGVIGSFSQADVGMGLRVLDSASVDGDYTIVSVDSDGLGVEVLGAAMSSAADASVLSLSVFEPIRTTKGKVIFQIQTATPLTRDLAHEEVIDLVKSPKVKNAVTALDTMLSIYTDLHIISGDLLWVDNNTDYEITLAVRSSEYSPMWRMPRWDLTLKIGLTSLLSDMNSLYNITSRKILAGSPTTSFAVSFQEPASPLV